MTDERDEVQPTADGDNRSDYGLSSVHSESTEIEGTTEPERESPTPSPTGDPIARQMRPYFEHLEAVQRSLAQFAEPISRMQQQLQAQLGPMLAAQRFAEQQRAVIEPFMRTHERIVEQFAPLAAAQQAWAEQFRFQARALERLLPVLPKIDFEGLRDAVTAWREAMPPNWADDIEYDRLHGVVYEHGLPIVWVPRAEILDELLRLDSLEERLAVLRRRRSEVLEDCERVLSSVTHPRLASQAPLAVSAVRALAEGHAEAAQALAVAVADTTIRAFLDKKYGKVRDMVREELDDVAVMRLRTVVALAPVHVFFTEYWPDRGDLMPEALSRHVTIHMATVEHIHPDNSLVAVMLMTSLLRTFHDMAALA